MGLPAFRGFRPVGMRRAGEKKLIDVAVTAYDVNTTGSFTLLNGCVQGSDYTQRIGRKILLKSVYIRGFVTPQQAVVPSAATASVAQQVRMILFVDSQPNGAAPAVTDLLNTAHPASQLNLNNRDRFKVLRDEVINFGPLMPGVGTFAELGADLIGDVNVYKKLNLETIYNAGNAGTIADINSGALYMFWIGSVASNDQDSLARVSARVRFLDP